jgi:hypothetical protein
MMEPWDGDESSKQFSERFLPVLIQMFLVAKEETRLLLSQSRRASNSSLVVPKVRISSVSLPCLRTRTQALSVALCTSIPQQRR